MALTMHQKKVVTRQLVGRYKPATKREKRLILDEFVAITGYNRAYAAWALRNSPEPGQPAKKKPPRPRSRKYGQQESKALRKIWAVLSMPCGKRLAPYMEEIVRVLERCGELELDPLVRDNLLSISASTIDRMMAPERKRIRHKGRRGTRPGTLLKHQVPIL